MFKSSEEREAARREREAAQAQAAEKLAEQERQAAEERQRAQWLASPQGAATTAMEAGQAFFEIQLQVGGHTGNASFGATDSRRTVASSAAILGEIEKLGWRLEHAGYYYMVTGESSTARVFVSGEATVISGVTVGVYLFRNTRLAESVG